MKKAFTILLKIIIIICVFLGLVMLIGKPVIEADNFDKWIFRLGNAVPFFIFALSGIVCLILDKCIEKKKILFKTVAVFLAFVLSVVSNIAITNLHSIDYEERYDIYKLEKKAEEEKYQQEEKTEIPEKSTTKKESSELVSDTLANKEDDKETTTEISTTESTTKLQEQLMFIPGCNSYDIMLSIEDRFGIKKPSPVESYGVDGYSFSNFDNNFEYIIYTYDNLNDVYMADFSYSNFNQNKNEFIESAKIYLGYAATIPYDTAQQKEAKEWVISNLPNVKYGSTIEKVFGDALYRLCGNLENGVIDLEISVYPFPY